MVSNCCKLMVKNEFNKLGIKISRIELGELEVKQKISLRQFDKIRSVLKKNGHELMEDKKSIQIEKVKAAIINTIHYSDELPEVKFSEYLSTKLECDYTYLSNLFSEVTGTTLQQFIIVHKIERAKELIIYNEMSLKEIAFKLHYSSLPHFSNQFKKITGLSPVFFKSLKKKKRIALEQLIENQKLK
ncbi:transcriptional regulator, AraC family [Cytophaga hutchinsonii ATCC 33406]|nr:transcriptional regulator, AraC family [Cytophaga hutchinsonii ATCC 33406]